MKPKKIIAVRNDRFGEFLLNIPVFRALKENFPQAGLTVVVNPYVKGLAERIPFIDKILCWENKKHGFFEKMGFVRTLKAETAELIIILNPSREFNFMAYLSGIPLRVGYARKSAFFLNRKIADRKEEGLRHEVDYNLELLRPIGINTAAGNFNDLLRLEENDFSQERMDFLGLAEGEFIVLHPWASNRQKEWGGFNFRRLFEKLGAQYQHKLVMIGAKEDLPRSEQLALELNLINLTGRTSLVELAGLLKKSRLLVTNDSGPMHLAGVLGVPTVALFRKSPPAVSARRWGPIGNRHIIIENEVLADIQISEVYDAVKKIITG